MSKGKESARPVRGFRCSVCTGCGACPGISRRDPLQGIRILTEAGINMDRLSLANEDHRRLMVADIGTTTIAMELLREDGTVEDSFALVNPQTRYGSDVLSRILAAETAEKKQDMQKMVRSALARGAERFLRFLKPEEKPCMVIAANTVMTYLLMGWDPRELGQAPFAASKLQGGAFELFPEGKSDKTVPCAVLPGFSAFVGGDLFAGAVACRLAEREEITLLVDLGTNGEILLGNRERVLATATAAGPAFEGGPAKGTWGANLVKAVAGLLDEALLDETGLLADPFFEKGVRVGNALLTKEAIRSLQVAKAAILAGIQSLMARAGITAKEVDRVILGGGFGYFLNPADAVRIGMLPGALGEKAFSGGNTALAGAKRVGEFMLQRHAWEQEATLARGLGQWEETAGLMKKVEVLNLAEQPEFREQYLKAMAFLPVE